MNFPGAAIQPHPLAVLGNNLHLKGNEELGLVTFPNSTAKPGDLPVASHRFAKYPKQSYRLIIYLKKYLSINFL